MNDLIKLWTCGNKNYLKKLKRLNSEEESFTYKLISDEMIFRYGLLDTGEHYVIPSGGPKIVENKTIRGIPDKTVKSVQKIDNYGFVITFE